MNSDEIYASAVHELGHILGLKHNESRRSIMYFFDVDGTEALDSVDIMDLSRLHTLRPAPKAPCVVPIAAADVIECSAS